MPSLDELQDFWSGDVNIDNTDLANESIKIPKLHAKYYKLYSRENLLLQKLSRDYDKLYLLKSEYYLGKISDEDLKANNWQPFELKVLRQDLEMYLQADNAIIELLLKIAVQREKADFLKDVIKQITNRNFTIKNAVDFLRFCAGG